MLGKSKRDRELEATQAIQQDYTRLLNDVAQALTSTLELEIVLTTVMTKMAQVFGPENWSMLLVDKERNDLYYAIAAGSDSNSLRGLRVPMGEGVAGWVAHTGKPMVVPDVSVEPSWQEFSRRNPGLNIQSIACIPISSAEGVLGVIQLLNSKVDRLTDYSMQFLRVLCDFAAIAIRNAADMKRIHELSITDDCTGLYNARHLYTLLEEQFARTGEQSFNLLFIDLDHFKSINDTHGHLVGSRLLKEVGDMIKRITGTKNPAFRYGGDEFVVLLPDLSKQGGREIAERLFETLRGSKFAEAEGLSLNLRGSFGMANYPEDGTSIETIIKAADDMMYHVKGTTRDNLAIAGLGSLYASKVIDGKPAHARESAASQGHAALGQGSDNAAEAATLLAEHIRSSEAETANGRGDGPQVRKERATAANGAERGSGSAAAVAESHRDSVLR